MRLGWQGKGRRKELRRGKEKGEGERRDVSWKGEIKQKKKKKGGKKNITEVYFA